MSGYRVRKESRLEGEKREIGVTIKGWNEGHLR